jgi:protein PhnA
MPIEQVLIERSGSSCELCSSNTGLGVYEVSASGGSSAQTSILVCEVCLGQITKTADMDVKHWHCLSTSMWSEVPVVQVMAWRLLNRLRAEGWAQDLLEQIYLDEETLKWAEAETSEEDEQTLPTKDSNGNTLLAGDTVTLIKDLDVKGANFTAKRGTVVKNISLTSNPEHIEGRVNGTQIVLVAKFLKKA